MIFAFEGEGVASLAWMPFDVRRKLDLAGLRPSLSAWDSWSIDARRELERAVVESADDVAAFRAKVLALGPVPDRSAVAWEDRPWARGCEALVDRAREQGFEVDRARWAALPDPARYALHRLSDPKKDAAKLVAALEELGVGTPRAYPSAPSS